MKKAAAGRVSKGVQQAKDLGVYTKTLEKELTRKEQALRFNVPSSSKVKIDKGIIGSVGRIKNGVMKVSKHIIDSVEGKSKKKFGKKGGGGFARKSLKL